jgi:hypothetical protein
MRVKSEGLLPKVLEFDICLLDGRRSGEFPRTPYEKRENMPRPEIGGTWILHKNLQKLKRLGG